MKIRIKNKFLILEEKGEQQIIGIDFIKYISVKDNTIKIYTAGDSFPVFEASAKDFQEIDKVIQYIVNA